MGLTERLGYKHLSSLYSNMTANEILEWAAYDLTNSPEWIEKFNNLPKELTHEEEADAIFNLLTGVASGPNIRANNKTKSR